MDNVTLVKTYRKKLANLHAITVFIVSLSEILAYAIFVFLGECELVLWDSYLLNCVLLPIVLNVLTHIVVRNVIRADKVKHRTKNSVVVYGTLVTAFIISVVHRKYVVTACSFVFPVILSSLFTDRRLLRQSILLSTLSLTITWVLVFLENRAYSTYGLNLMVLYAFLAVTYFSGKIAIDNSEMNSFVIENQAIANRKLRNKMKKDPMTDLYNHNTFFTEIENAIKIAEKDDNVFSVAMFDIDDFKLINDTYGHDSGDEVLIALSEIIKKNCTKSEIPFRYGGEEFAIISAGKNASETYGTMTKVLSDFKSCRFTFTDRELTFSCGIAQFKPGMTKEELFDLADDGMYVAKNSGKNQIYLGDLKTVSNP